MQVNSPWYTPPSSALNNEPNNSNYFYNYNHHWSRPPGNYDNRYYQNQQQQQHMRGCGDNYPTTNQNAHPGNFECQPPGFFRQGTTDYDTSQHMRNRNRLNNQQIPHSDSQQQNFDKMRSSRPSTKTNDCEGENFSSVFTQSLTSLYSQDVEGNFVEEKNFGEDRNGGLIPCNKIKTEEPSSDCQSEYGFNSVYDVEAQNPVLPDFGTVKVKTEPFSRDDAQTYENYSLDDMYVRRRRGTLAEAYSRKRKHSVPNTAYASGMSMNSNEDKCRRMYQPESQWIPNAVRASEESVNGSYQSQEFSERYSGFEGPKAKKHQPLKPRVTRRSEASEAKTSSASKKLPKKISPLTVYVKVLDDRILDVTCRRYKKRSKPKMSSDGVAGEEGSISNAPVPHNQIMCPNESWRNVFNIVGGLLKSLVDKVARTVEPKQLNSPELISIHPMKAKELLYRFCCDYNLDFRDFTNLEEILYSDVTANKDETPCRKRKGDRVHSRFEEQPNPRRGRSADNDEVIIAKVIEKIPEEEIAKEKPPVPMEQVKECTKAKNVPKSKSKAKTTRSSKQQQKSQDQETEREKEKEEPEEPLPPRILRSLPSRQPRPATKKTRSRKRITNVKNRYPKRNLRNKRGTASRGGKKIKIIIDLSKENDTTEILQVDSDSTSNHTFGKCEIKSEVDSDNDIQTSEADPKEVSNNKSHDTEVKDENEDTNNSDMTERMKTMVALAKKQTLSIPLVEIKTEFDDGLRQPPKLVRMTDDNNAFREPRDDKDFTKVKLEGNLESSKTFLKENEDAPSPGDNAPPPTLQPNENYPQLMQTDTTVTVTSSEVDTNATKMEPEITTCDDDEVEKLGEVVNRLTPDSRTETKTSDETKFDDETVLAEMKVTDTNNINTTRCESNSEDDCIVLVQKDPKKSPPDILVPKFTDFSDISILKDNFISKSIFGKDGEISLDPKSLSLSTSLKAITKDEQEESILRSLLLETEAVTNSNIVKEFESSDGSNSVLENLLGNARKDAFSSLNMETIQSAEFNNQLQNLANESFGDMAEALHLPKFCTAYQEAYLSGVSVESFEEAQKLFKDSAIPPLNQIITKCELKEAVTKDTNQMKDKIKKLKNEIVYLQLMADQKEKEKVAIVCFKRYKEEILRRIYKAYAFSVQDHVRDWIFAKCEGSSDSCSASSSSTNSFLPPTPSPRSDTNCTLTEPSATSSRGIRSKEPASSSTASAATASSSSVFTSTIIPSSKDQTVSSTVTDTTTATSIVASTVEKVSAVETMVAKATENYGLDMSNLRDRLRCSPDTPTSATSSQGTILQKVLSSQSPSRNTTPGRPFRPQMWSPDNNSKIRNNSAKPAKTMIAKPYPEKLNIPLDIMMNKAPKNGSTSSTPAAKETDPFKKSQDGSRSHIAERSQIQTLLAEPVQIKTHRNPYGSWSIQSGSRINGNGPTFPKPVPGILPPSTSMPSVVKSSVVESESPLQRQLKSTKPLSMQNYDMAIAPVKPGFVSAGHRPLLPPAAEKLSSEGFRKRTDEDRRKMNKFESSFSAVTPSNSGPFGSTAINTGIPLVPNLQTNKNRPSSRSSPPLCMGCGFTTAKFICSGCRKHWYCSSRCQCLIWPEHSRVCEGRPFPQPPNPFT